MDVDSPSEAARNTQEQDSLAALIAGTVSRDLMIVNYATKIGKSLKKKSSKKKEKLVTLNGTGTTASPIRFDHPEEAFGSKHIATVDMPTDSSFETFENETDFKSLVHEKDNTKMFRNTLLIPPFAVVALVPLSFIDPAKIAMAISASPQDSKSKLKDHEDFDSKDHNMATN